MQFFLNGLITGSLYALVAGGFALIYGTNRFVHFAHGSVITYCAYMLMASTSLWGVPWYVSFLLLPLFGACFGWLLFRVVYLPMMRKGSSSSVLLIASIALMLLLDNLVQVLFGVGVQTTSGIPSLGSLNIAGGIVTGWQLVTMGLAVLLLIGLWVFTKRTSMGTKMRAVADHPELASLTGIASETIQGMSFLVGSFLASIAGLCMAIVLSVEPLMGTNMMIKGFTGAVIGGISSLPGAVLGGALLGMIENLGVIVMSSGFKDALGFVILLAFLLLRPQGIFGISKGVRK